MKMATLAVVEVRTLVKNGAHEFHQITLEGTGCGKCRRWTLKLCPRKRPG